MATINAARAVLRAIAHGAHMEHDSQVSGMVFARAEAAASGRSLRETAREAGVDEAVLDEALDYHAMAKPHG